MSLAHGPAGSEVNEIFIGCSLTIICCELLCGVPPRLGVAELLPKPFTGSEPWLGWVTTVWCLAVSEKAGFALRFGGEYLGV